MSNKPSRDSLFPATSIGRSSGSRILSGSTGNSTLSSGSTHSLSRTPSHESLIAHPLLSPSSTGNGASTSTGSSANANLNSTSTAWDNGYSGSSSSLGGGGGNSNSIGYVPYTPRHRPPAHSHSYPSSSTISSHSPSLLVTSATTSMSTVPSSSQHAQAQGDATSKLQLMNLKAAAQGLGLDMGSVGWAIVEALVGIGSSSGGEDEETEAEWKEAWEALSTGKATLLLPLESISQLPPTPRSPNNDRQKQEKENKKAVITPGFVKNHIVFCEPANLMSGKGKSPMKVVTLSGLRGVIEDQSITMTSTLHPSTKAFQDISTPGTRAAGFAALFPTTTHTSYFPQYSLPSHNPSLSLPPRGSLHFPSAQSKPPLPPRRPTGAVASSPSSGAALNAPSRPTTPQGGSRLSSLASLFGRSSSQSQPNAQTNQGVGSISQSSSPLIGTQPLPLGLESGGGTSSRPPSILSVSETGSVASVEGVIQTSGVPTNQVSISVGAYTIGESLVEQKVLGGIWMGIVEGEVPAFLAQTDSRATSGDNSEVGLTDEETAEMQAWLVDKAVEFLEKQKAFPVLRTGSSGSKANRPKIAKRLASATSIAAEVEARGAKGVEGVYEYAVNEYGDKEGFGDVEDLGARWQEFYLDFEDEVRERRRVEVEMQEEKEKEEEEKEEEEEKKGDPEVEADKEDRRVRNVMEKMELTVCSAGGIYERLFSSPSPCISATAPEATTNVDEPGDGEDSVDPMLVTDAAHDEALSSRIAALTMVEFSLSDLDIDVGGLKEGSVEDQEVERKKREEGVLGVVEACGKTLALLEVTFTPAEKAGVLVKAHRTLVDGLTKLPPIRLKAEVESAQNTPLPGDYQKSSFAEDIEDGPPTAVPTKEKFTLSSSDRVSSRGSIHSESMEDSRHDGKNATDNDEDEVHTTQLRPGSPQSPISPVSLIVTPAETPDIEPPTTPVGDDSSPSTSPASGSQQTPASPVSPHSEPPTSASQAALSLDTIFPLLILSVVKTNPPHLISHLLYIQRFRNRTFGGEEAYCLVNLMAVAEFIGALDPQTITSTRMGVFPVPEGAETPSGPVPIPIPLGRQSLPSSRRGSISSLRSAGTSTAGATSQSVASSFTLRNRVEQQVDAISSSANKVLTGMSGVVDSSFGLFKSMNVNLSFPGVSLNGVTLTGLLPNSPDPATPAINSAQAAAPWNGKVVSGVVVKEGTGGTIGDVGVPEDNPREAMVRKESGFSIKGLKLPGMVLPGVGRGSGSGAKEEEMVSVSRPGSVRSRRSLGSKFGADTTDEGESSIEGEGDEDEESEDDAEDEDDEGGEDEDDSDEGEGYYRSGAASDTRSIKSFESMMSSRRKAATSKNSKSKKTAKNVADAARKSLSDRLAKVSSGLAGGSRKNASKTGKTISPPESRRSSLLITNNLTTTTTTTTNRFDTPVSSRPQSPAIPSQGTMYSPVLRLAPPSKRFVECMSADELRVGEVGELLREYKRIVEGVRAAGGFVEGGFN